jgi:molybdopterin/thiamine biosynthesis adenylyltransferase/rhodanese-related sulfurtransferase
MGTGLVTPVPNRRIVETEPVPLRYHRQMILPEVGIEGQRKLRAGRVLIVGAGGLGSPAALYLAAAGVGRLGLVDFDAVDETNLQRQILYSTNDVGRPKLAAAASRLRGLNPDVEVVCHEAPFGAGNALALVSAYDVVIDGTDNFPTRYLVNDACVMAGTPNVYGSVFRFEGQVSVFATPQGPCYRCLHPEPPPAGLIPNCAEAGVLGVLPGLIGTVQATEAIKWLMGIGDGLIGRLLLYDALRLRFREIALPRDRACPVCGDAPTIRTLVAYAEACETRAEGDMTVEELHQWRRDRRSHVLVDVREPSEAAICKIEGSLLVPLSSLPNRIADLPTDRPIVVHCKLGGRSARATAMLRAKGFDAHNLSGGIAAWADRIDPALTRY